MILACHNLSKSFGDQVIVKDGSFHIENHEKAALVGINGAGKSTILKMIVGQLSPDAGTVVLTKGKTLGYLAQHQEMESGNTIYEEVRTAKAEVIEMEKQIRTIEIELPSLSGDALEARIVTAGGRVAIVVCAAPTLGEALEKCNREVGKVRCDNLFHRTDIGRKAIK